MKFFDRLETMCGALGGNSPKTPAPERGLPSSVESAIQATYGHLVIRPRFDLATLAAGLPSMSSAPSIPEAHLQSHREPG